MHKYSLTDQLLNNDQECLKPLSILQFLIMHLSQTGLCILDSKKEDW